MWFSEVKLRAFFVRSQSYVAIGFRVMLSKKDPRDTLTYEL